MTALRFDSSKRDFLRGRSKKRPAAIRPPWTNEARLDDACTRCGNCIAACPEDVLFVGEGDFPAFNPRLGTGECTFCGACAEACEARVFDLTRDTPWTITAVLDPTECLAFESIHCEACRDFCDVRAIAMPPRAGGPSRPTLDSEKCTGCGACVAPCPGNALRLAIPSTREYAA